MTDKKIILADIASQLNISKMTVSRALNGQNGVGEALSKEIRLAATNMGYSFERLRSGGEKRKYVYIISKLSQEPHSYYYDVYSHLKKICAEENWEIYLHISETEDEQRGILPEKIHDVNGIIYAAAKDDDILIEYIDKLGIPYVMNSLAILKNADYVIFDDYFNCMLLTDYLYKKGYKKIGFVGGDHYRSGFLIRYHGFLHVLKKYNLPYREEWLIDNYDREAGLYKLDYILPRPLPEAIICYSDRAAWYFFEKIKIEGIKVPDDIALISFNNSSLTKKCNPSLTSLNIKAELVAKESLKLLDERIKGRTTPRRVYLDAGIIEGLSTPEKKRRSLKREKV